MQLPGEVWNPLPHLVLNLSLPDGTWKNLEKLDIVVSVVSTCILHDNTAGGISVFCNLWTLSAFCLCDIAEPKLIPFSDFLSQELTQSPVPYHFTIFDCQFQMPFQPVKQPISRMGVVEIVFDIIAHICLFNALLLCSTPLNRFMKKKEAKST